MNRVAAIVLHYGMNDLTRTAVAHIQNQYMSSDVYVIDNGSPQPFEDRRIQVIRLSKNHFYAGGYNRGIKFVLESGDYKYIWIVTNDVQLRSRLTLTYLYNDLEIYQNCADVVPSSLSNLDFLRYDRGRSGVRAVRFTEWTMALIRSDAWREVGPMVESLKASCMDLEWCYRAAVLGWASMVDYRVQIDHPYSGTWNGMKDCLPTTQLTSYGKDEEELVRLYGPQWKRELWPEVAGVSKPVLRLEKVRGPVHG